jgi:polyisoprenoid-binding protein YceI
MPANVEGCKKGTSHYFKIVSNEEWKEHTMKHRAITFAFAACFVSSLAFAGDTWTLDSGTSNARLFQGSRVNPDSVNTGVARVTGKVRLDTGDLDHSVFDLSIYPADENWGYELTPEGNLPAGYVPDATDDTLLTFKSTRILTTGNRKLEVIGDLTLTRVERSVTADANEAYAGPVYVNPVIHTETREVTFQFPNRSVAMPSGAATPVALGEKRDLDLSGSARVVQEDFPELLSAIQDTNWPSVVRNEHCQAAYEGGGEGYSGAVCTGALIAATHADNCQAAYEGGGEGYGGPVCTPPAGSQTTIVLDLKLHHTMPEPSARLLSVDGKTR